MKPLGSVSMSLFVILLQKTIFFDLLTVASIAFIAQPFGSILSGFSNEAIGRKWTIILINIFLLISWSMLAYSSSALMAFSAFGILGFGLGLSSAPSMTYIGEIW